MSSASRRGRRPAIALSTAAACTINQTTLGFRNFFTRSCSEEDPTAFSPTSSLTALGDMSKTTHSWPPLIRRRTMLAPILPRPIIPSCIVVFLSSWVRSLLVCSGNGRLEDALNRAIQHGVKLRSGLLGRQALDERPREAGHDAVIPAEAIVAFSPRIPPRQRDHFQNLWMFDAIGIKVVALRQRDLEHDRLIRRQLGELFEDDRL